MAAAIHSRTVEAQLSVRVSQAAGGDLAAGARAQIERVDGVSVDDLSIAGIQPGLNDTTVDAIATLSVDWGSQDAAAADRETVAVRVAERLADGFGVEPEHVERLDSG
ncbi:hypothetical protein [Halorubrum sp. DTA46]|uniref:hypothetical protein n=1 Tax=Halorubrum sp. DTA46 TaxID=3402162 RepID=UPI003AAFA254